MKKLLIFGGSGFLGHKLTLKYIDTHLIYIYSRDEAKHWKMKLDFNNSPNLVFIIGDIRDKEKVCNVLSRTNPDIVIIASALKHIEKCEEEIDESIQTNIIGTQNVVNCIEEHHISLTRLKKVCFISTDKACSPVNVYGMCKAISEAIIVQKSIILKNIDFTVVRYGNVLNSTGSIIPSLHAIGKNPRIESYNITDMNMTRFLMTHDDSTDLINHAITVGHSGDIIIPKLISCKIIDLITIFSELYNKPINISNIRPGEKILESLINETQSRRLVINNEYYYIKPFEVDESSRGDTIDYNSRINPLSCEQLKQYLIDYDIV